MLVQDSVTEASQLKVALEEHGCRVMVAATGQDALAAARVYRPDLILSDTVMPGMDGYALCHVVKHDDSLSDVPVILLTSFSDPEDIIRALAARADYCLARPFSVARLSSRVRSALDASTHKASEGDAAGLEIGYAGKRHVIASDRRQMLGLLLSTYDDAVHQNEELLEMRHALQALNEQLEARDVSGAVQAEREIRERTEDLALVNALNSASNRGASLPEICELLAQESGRIFDSHGASVYLVSEDGAYLVGQRLDLSPDARRRIEKLIGMPVPATRIPLKAGTLYQEVLQAGKPCLVNDPQTVRRMILEFTETVHLPQPFRRMVQGLVPQIQEILGIRSVIDVPLVAGHQVIGLLEISRGETFTEQDLHRLVTVSGQLTAIISRKRADEALQAYSARLAELVEEQTRELQQAQEQLVRRERLALLGQLSGSVGHELRNPLGAIKNAAYFLNLVLEDREPEVSDMLGILEREVTTCDRIIASLLGFARTGTPARQRVDINDLVREAVARTPMPDAPRVETVWELDETLPALLADAEQLRQVLENLVRNAIQAMPEGGQLALRSEVDDRGWMVVSVADTGVGIQEENLSRLFEPLFTTKAKGIGLGLALVKALVEGHGGTVEVRSEGVPGKGSTFAIRLPVGEIGETVDEDAQG